MPYLESPHEIFTFIFINRKRDLPPLELEREGSLSDIQ